MLYNQLELGDYVYDPEMDAYGVVKEIEDIHNVFVEYDDDGGSGLYCIDPKCPEFDAHHLKIIKNNEGKEV